MCTLQMFYALQHFFFDCNSSFKARARRGGHQSWQEFQATLGINFGYDLNPCLTEWQA